MMELPSGIPAGRPVLIAGPTASGKSALALALARRDGGVVVNADAMQVYRNWRILTARPSQADMAQAPHALYGHVGPDREYSVGHWLREAAILLEGRQRPIIVGGTGLYFAALTEGLARIPAIPAAIRDDAARRLAAGGATALLSDLDPATLARIDRRNPARVRRAWEVQKATGRGLADWHAGTQPPLLPLHDAAAFLVEAPPERLAARIAARFDAMLESGVLEEVRANLDAWNPRLPWARAIGGPELVAHLRGEKALDAARAAVIISTRQYAKRQRTWFRARMGGWTVIRSAA